MVSDALRILTFSTLFPSSVRPGHGIFVETRLRELVSSGKVQSRVVAPVPWFFSAHPRFGQYARIARTPAQESRNGLDVSHPRYLLPPAIGMHIAPVLLAAGAMPAIHRLRKEGFDFDVIDAHYYYPDGVAAAILARRFNKPFTVTARGSDINLIAKYAIPLRWMRWAARRATASIGVSVALTKEMARIGMPGQSLRTMPNGVDLNRFDLSPQGPARAELGWPEQPTLLSVGNLVENKGHHIAIEAMQYLPDFRLIIAGEGPQRNALESLARLKRVSPQIQFLGSIDQSKLARVYAAADILVLASSREGWPNVLLEAMACGTPVVATNVGGISEIVTSPIAGYLMPERTCQHLVDAVLALWRCLPSRSAVRQRAAQCGWAATTAAQLSMFEQIAAGPRKVYA